MYRPPVLTLARALLRAVPTLSTLDVKRAGFLYARLCGESPCVWLLAAFTGLLASDPRFTPEARASIIKITRDLFTEVNTKEN